MTSPVALGMAILLAFGLQLWIGRSYSRSTAQDPSDSAELAFVIQRVIGTVILLKLVYLSLPDLVPEEAYYWQYAQRPALGYLDHPAMVAWGIIAGTSLFGDTEFGVRIFTFLCWLATAGFIGGLARDLFGKRVGQASFLLTCLIPYPFIFGFFATPDAPMMASWAGALFYLQRALFRESRLAWVGFGVCMGLGMLSKYSMVLLAPAALAFMLLDKSSRRWFLRPDPYLAILWSVLIFSPVLIWNFQHDWASFAYQSARRLQEDPEFTLHKLLSYAFLLLTPWGVFGAVRALTKKGDWGKAMGLAEVNASRHRLFLILVWLVPFAVFALSSLNHRTKVSWTGPAWLSLIPVVAAQWLYLPRVGLAGIKWMQPGHWRCLVIFLTLVYGGIFHYMTLGLPGIPYRQKSVKPVAWEELGAQVQILAEELKAEDEAAGNDREVYVVGIDRFPIASELAFYRRAGVRVLETTRTGFIYGGDGVMYEKWFPDPLPEDILMIFVGFDRSPLEDSRIAAHVRELGEVKVGQVMKRGKPAGRFYYRTGRGFIPNEH